MGRWTCTPRVRGGAKKEKIEHEKTENSQLSFLLSLSISPFHCEPIKKEKQQHRVKHVKGGGGGEGDRLQHQDTALSLVYRTSLPLPIFSANPNGGTVASHGLNYCMITLLLCYNCHDHSSFKRTIIQHLYEHVQCPSFVSLIFGLENDHQKGKCCGERKRESVCVCLIYLLIVLSLSYSSSTLSAGEESLWGPSREV